MIFAKNPAPGKVKTRLAKTIGNEKAMEVYQWLLSYTRQITGEVDAGKAVFFSEFLEEKGVFETGKYRKYLQVGDDLGEKMITAFDLAFRKGFSKAVIIGTDCYELTDTIIEEAFQALEDHDVVVGPAHDGGYYLLGMKEVYHPLFRDKTWSTENVFLDTLIDIQRLELTYHTLTTLNDLDDEEDLADLREQMPRNTFL